MASFNNIVLETVNHISLPQAISKDDVKTFESHGLDWCKLPVQLHVFDFKALRSLHRSIYPAVLKFRSAAEANNAKLISINLNADLLEQLKKDGMDKPFGHLKNLKLLDPPKSKDTPDEIRNWLIKYLVEAARAAMNTMFSTTVAADENYREITRDFNPESYYKIAMITADGPMMRARFRLYFQKATLEGLTRTMLSPGVIADSETLESTATELLNIIYTTAKSKLNNERGYELPPAIPILISAAQALAAHKGSARDTSVIPLVTPLGAYYLELELGA